MKERWNGKRLLYLMLIIVVFSLCLTAIIVTGLIDDADGKESKYWFFEESIQTGKVVELRNVYIQTCANEKIEFLYDNVTYVVPGKLDEAYIGVADIIVEGDKISKVRIKPDSTTGTLYSYDDTTLQVSGDELKSMNMGTGIPVYKISESAVEQSSWNDMIIGTSVIKCVLEKGQVCSVIIEDSLPSDIRVVIKNGSIIFHENIYIKKKSDNTLINVKQSLLDALKAEFMMLLLIFDQIL